METSVFYNNKVNIIFENVKEELQKENTECVKKTSYRMLEMIKIIKNKCNQKTFPRKVLTSFRSFKMIL